MLLAFVTELHISLIHLLHALYRVIKFATTSSSSLYTSRLQPPHQAPL